MAERRMFTKKIVDSDAFLDMPLSTQALYFHLNMRADDDGFVNNPKKIQRMIGASEDDLKLLLAKRFVLGFDSGIVVIKHWRMHNLLRKDRYNPTQYGEERAALTLNDNGSYTEILPELPMATEWQPNDTQMAPQDSIGKVSIVKDSIGECECRGSQGAPAPANTPTLDDVIQYCTSKGYTFAGKFYAYYQSVNWLDKNGKLIDWKAKADYWKLSDDAKQTKPSRYMNSDANQAMEIAEDRTYRKQPKTAGEDEVIRKRAEQLQASLKKGGEAV